MNNKKTILFTLVLLLYLTGCGSYLSTSSTYTNYEEEANINIYMDDADILVDAKEIVLYIENTGEEMLAFGADWHLEMLDDTEWKTINKRSPTGDLDVFVTQVSTLCHPGEIKEAKINMSMYPYDFKCGTYRFIQEISSNKVIMVEFQMTE